MKYDNSVKDLTETIKLNDNAITRDRDRYWANCQLIILIFLDCKY